MEENASGRYVTEVEVGFDDENIAGIVGVCPFPRAEVANSIQAEVVRALNRKGNPNPAATKFRAAKHRRPDGVYVAYLEVQLNAGGVEPTVEVAQGVATVAAKALHLFGVKVYSTGVTQELGNDDDLLLGDPDD